MYKKIFQTGIIAYIGLLILAVLFYKERSICGDSAFQAFTILKNGSLTIQNFRFGAAITEAGPLLARQLHFSVNNVLLTYSIIFILYYLGCYLMCGFVFRNYRMALLLLLFNLLFVSDSFYFMQSELPQGVAMMTVVFAYITRENAAKPGIIQYVLLMAAVVTVAFFHPLIIIPFSFAVLFLLLTKNSVEHKQLLWLSIICFIIATVVKKAFFGNSYDENATNNSLNALKNLQDFFSLPTNKRFIKYCIDNYYWMPLSAAAIIITYMVQRSWVKLALFLLFWGGYISLVNLSYAYSFPTDTYIENLYLPLGIIVGLPLLYDVLPCFEKYYIPLCIMVLIMATGIIRIYNTHHVYTNRQNWQRKFMKDNGYHKILTADYKVPMDTVIYTWSTPYEFLFLSTIETGKPVCIYISDDIDKHLDVAKWENKALLTPWGSVDYKDIPKEYFLLTDTSLYTIIK